MDIILFHPSHVHVPTPQVPPSSLLSKRVIGGTSPLASKAATKTERESSPLIQEVVIPLQRRGLIAATLSTGVRKWQGVVRLPERDQVDEWGDRSERVKSIEADKGLFRRMDLKWVLCFTGLVMY
jgi:DNA polymerase beta